LQIGDREADCGRARRAALCAANRIDWLSVAGAPEGALCAACLAASTYARAPMPRPP